MKKYSSEQGIKHSKLFQYLISNHQNRTTQQAENEKSLKIRPGQSEKKMGNIQKNKWSYLEISLLSSMSQTPQQSHAPLFLAFSSSSHHTPFLPNSQKNPSVFPTILSHFSPPFFSLVSSFASHSSALLFTGQQAWLAQPLSLLLHACCSRHQALSFMAVRPIWPGFMVREGGSPSHFQRITAKLHSNSPKTLLNPPTGVSTLLQLQKVRLIPYGY